ncbi:MAG: hypothetical protein EHM57_05990 [Actinobacteria bacterium]|nr:MAG: hypothetical protein EHM57_05990 [Actinomycetota bacterium]
MREFSVTLLNRPGQLAALARKLADAGVNIETLAALAVDGESLARFMVDDDEAARRTLREAGVRFEERVVLDTFLPNQPGSLAAMAEGLASSGINIDSIYLLHSSADGLHFAVTVDDAEAAGAVMAAS